jgi:hypothetical protein
VRSYYRLVDSGAYRRAWKLFGPTVQAELGGFQAWKEGYRYTRHTTLSDLGTTGAENNQYVFAITLKAVSRDACGDEVPQAYAGSWTVSRVGSQFKAAAISATQTGGGTPIADPAECPSVGLPSSSCDPNYVGACLDPSAYDYDCLGGTGDGPQYTGTVEVVGTDRFGLDANGNGVGCE